MKIVNSASLAQQLEQTIRADIASGKVGGAAVRVMQHNEICYENCFTADYMGMTVKPDTQFRMASMTKPVTAVAVLRLAEQGLLSLSDPVSRYLPDFSSHQLGCATDNNVRTCGLATHKITIKQLLSHSSGLGSGPVGSFFSVTRPRESTEDLAAAVRWYQSVPLDFNPGTAQAYSAVFGFDVLARIVELVSKMDYESFLQQEILKPLGMNDTTFKPTPDQWNRMIPMHNYEDGYGKITYFDKNCVFENFPVSYTAGGAGLTSTLSDYTHFAQMLLNGGSLNGHQILREETVKQMATPQLTPAIMPGNQIWGLGVRVITSPAYQWLPVGTFGWSGAYGTHFWVDPENEIVAIYLKNSRYDGGSSAYTSLVFEQDVFHSLI